MTEEQFLKLKENPSWLELSCKVCDECYLAYTQVACATANDIKANAQQTQYKNQILRKQKDLFQTADIFKEHEDSPQKIGLLFSSKGFLSESHTSLTKKSYRKSNAEVKKSIQAIEEQKKKYQKQLPNIQKPSQYYLFQSLKTKEFEKMLVQNESESKDEQLKGLSLEEFIKKEKTGRKQQFMELQKQSANTTKHETSSNLKKESFFAKPHYKIDPKAIYYNPITPQCKLPRINKIDNSDALSSSTNTSARSKPTFEFMLTTIKDLKSHLVDLE